MSPFTPVLWHILSKNQRNAYELKHFCKRRSKTQQVICQVIRSALGLIPIPYPKTGIFISLTDFLSLSKRILPGNEENKNLRLWPMTNVNILPQFIQNIIMTQDNLISTDETQTKLSLETKTIKKVAYVRKDSNRKTKSSQIQ